MNPFKQIFKTSTGLITLALLTGLAGCAANNTAKAKPEIIHGERFTKDDAPTSIGRFAQAQVASGAKADAQLFDRNFHGDKLNSLGEAKLDLILKASPADEPVVIYLDMPHDAMMSRQAAVVAYLKDAGLTDAKIKLVEGPNLDNSNPTSAHLAEIYKADGSFGGQSTDPSAAAAGGPMGASASAGGK